MKKNQVCGFTLIELLTVIAIISILSSITLVGIGRVREKAKITKARTTMDHIATALDTYYSDHNSYPPAYGYLKVSPEEAALQTPSDATHFLKPYDAILSMYSTSVGDVSDNFSFSSDTDGDGMISLLEFTPERFEVGPDNYDYRNALYMGGSNLKTEAHSYIYIPVYSRNAEKVAKFYWNLAQSGSSADALDAYYAFAWDDLDRELSRLRFPPPRYDAYILMSVGPRGTTGGILADVFNVDDPSAYHLSALRAYYLATRDINDNGLLDFDFEAMTSGEGKINSYSAVIAKHGFDTNNEAEQINRLPNGQPIYGPLIKVGGK